jgi:transposase
MLTAARDAVANLTRIDLAARDLTGLLREIAKAKRRFGLPDEAVVASCYEAGRDGFWAVGVHHGLLP